MPIFQRKNKYSKPILNNTILILLFFALCSITANSAFAAELNLVWKASASSNVDGYKMHYGTSSRNYPYSVNVGNHTSCSISGLQEGKKYYFAATAYNAIKVESDYSGEFLYTVPTSSTSSTTSSGSTNDSGTTGSTSGSGSTGSTSGSGTTGSTSSSTPPGSSGSSDTIIIDNGDPNTEASGTWNVSSARGFYGSSSIYSKTLSSTYSFEAARSGAQEVYIWYTAYGNRCTNVPVEIYDGNTHLDTVTVNQQQNGGQWNQLGTYSFSGNARIIAISNGGCVTSADAVSFVATSSTGSTTSSGSTSGSGTTGSTSGSDTSGSTSGSGTTGSTSGSDTSGSTSGSTPSDTSLPSGTIVIDNGDPNTEASGSWNVSNARGFYGPNSIYSKTYLSTYSFEAACSGEQEVYMWYTAYSNRCTNVPVEIYDGNTYIDTVTVNQQKNGGQWNELGTYSFSGNARIVTTSYGGCITSVDAVSFVPTSSTSGSTPSGASGSSGSIIIDNGDPNTEASGLWNVSSARGFYGPNSIYSRTQSSTYSFEAACSGVQEVYLWYTAYGNRCTNVPVEIYDGNTYLDTVTVNQQENGGQWNQLGTYSFGGNAKVTIISNGDCVTSADAVYFFEPN